MLIMNDTMKSYKIFVLLCLATSVAYSQPSFTDASSLLPGAGSFYSWMQKGAADVDGDGLDDIIRANTSGQFFILKQPANPNTLWTEMSLGQIQSATPLTVSVADVDNNGIADILTGGEYNGVRIVKGNGDGSAFSATQLPDDAIFTQASALADINGDGWLDAFVSHDEGTSAIWRNTGSGTFVRDNMNIDLNTIPVSDNSGNYGIVFTDVNNDGFTDFYISKCRAGVTDPADPRRINQLYINSMDHHYTEESAARGMKDGRQSWITEIQDIDNDGDMDALIINHYEPSRLMVNNGSGFFTEITLGSGLETLPNGILQATMRDFDNDGYVDLLYAGMGGCGYYKNNGNNTFSSQSISPLTGSGQPLRSFVIGDYNHDGHQDIYASYYYGGAYPDRLWLNNGNTNHKLPVIVKGWDNNRNAIGARLTLKSGGKTQTREIRAGESYGLSHTHCIIFGLGQQTAIDELEIRWPDGKKDRLTGLEANKLVFVNEGKN